MTKEMINNGWWKIEIEIMWQWRQCDLKSLILAVLFRSSRFVYLAISKWWEWLAYWLHLPHLGLIAGKVCGRLTRAMARLATKSYFVDGDRYDDLCFMREAIRSMWAGAYHEKRHDYKSMKADDSNAICQIIEDYRISRTLGLADLHYQ